MRLFQKPSGVWAVDYVCPETNKRARVSTGQTDKAEARKRVAAILAGERPAEDNTAPPPPSSSTPVGVTMDALFRRVENAREGWAHSKSQATIRSNLKIMRGMEIDLPDGRRVPFRDVQVTEVSKGVLRGFVQELEARRYAPATVKRKLDMVSKALTLAEEWDIISARPKMPRMETPSNARTRVVSEREETAVFEAIAARHATQPTADWVRFGYLVAFLLDSACRKGEAEALREEWITQVGDRHRLTIPGWATKNGKPRTIPLTPRVVEALPYLIEHGVDARPPQPRGRLLFPYRGGFIWYRWQIIVGDLKALGFDLSDVVIHSFRHTTLTRLSERGMGIEKVADWAGQPLVIGAASIAIGDAPPLPVTFDGEASIRIPAGAPRLSDPVALPVEALDAVTVSLFLPEATTLPVHRLRQTLRDGDATAHVQPADAPRMRLGAVVSGIEVETDAPTRIVVAFGDSITEGTGSLPSGPGGWPERLNRRMVEGGTDWRVVNAGIGGNRLLHQGSGPSGLERLDADALAVPGARCLILLEGVNDLGRPARPEYAHEAITADDLIAGYRQVLTRARAQGFRVAIATLPPFEGANYFSATGEAIRQAANEWIRTSREPDAVIDFEAAVRDPAGPTRMAVEMQSGDWLHPSDAGYAAMARSVPLDVCD